MTASRARQLLAAVVLLPLLLAGCEGSDSGGGSGTWNEPARPTTTKPAASKPATTRSSAKPAATTQSAAKPAATSSSSGSGGAVGGDQVPFGSLKWVYGGKPNGSGARNGGVVISGARFSSRSVSFSYVHDLSAWGYSSGALGGIACLFVQKTNGQWVGGKFDWISSSRRSRGFENVFGGYSGWSLDGVPNPCAAAFVIVSPDGKRRSNVISGTWSR